MYVVTLYKALEKEQGGETVRCVSWTITKIQVLDTYWMTVFNVDMLMVERLKS